jgi:protein tyrosine/serine phosphatase
MDTPRLDLLLQVKLTVAPLPCPLDSSLSLTFCNQNSISLYHLGHLHSTSAWEPITEEVVLQALNLLVQPATYPAIVMCNQGRHRTGTVIGCLRKLQMWCLSSILEEYRRFAGPKVRVMNEQVSATEGEAIRSDQIEFSLPHLPFA